MSDDVLVKLQPHRSAIAKALQSLIEKATGRSLKFTLIIWSDTTHVGGTAHSLSYTTISTLPKALTAQALRNAGNQYEAEQDRLAQVALDPAKAN